MQRQAFGRYEVYQRISMGGMAEVFRAVHTPSGTMVALKRILPEVAEDEEFIKMFEDEARIASQLEHPYIARCLDFGHVDGDWYIAFEYVSGKDLRALFNQCSKAGEPPPLWFVCYVFGRIAEGLAYAHARKDAGGAPVSIVHRDVSPQNIIVSYEGDVKLIDFGIAKVRREGGVNLTLAGVTMGTAEYMAPEQAFSADRADARSDLYAVGVMLYEMLSGTRPVTGDDPRIIALRVERGEVKPLVHALPSVPPPLAGLAHRAMAARPEMRFQSAAEMRLALDKLVGHDAGGTLPLPLAVAARSRRTTTAITHDRKQTAATGTLRGTPVDHAPYEAARFPSLDAPLAESDPPPPPRSASAIPLIALAILLGVGVVVALALAQGPRSSAATTPSASSSTPPAGSLAAVTMSATPPDDTASSALHPLTKTPTASALHPATRPDAGARTMPTASTTVSRSVTQASRESVSTSQSDMPLPLAS